jgi:hypothetical protein
MKLIFSIIIPILFLLSCEQRIEVDKSTDDITFLEFSNKIKKIDLPLTAKCEKDLIGSTFDFENEIIKKYGSDNSLIYGKLAEKENYTVIMYLYPADVALPIIQTNNKKGEKISSLNLYEISCWEDDTISETSWFKINKDLSIELGDSSASFVRNDNGDIIESTIKSKVRHRMFKINNEGKISEQKN